MTASTAIGSGRWGGLRGALSSVDRPRLAAISRRSQEALVVAGLTGASIGLVVAGFELVTAEVLLEAVLGLPLALQVAAPGAGLLVSAILLRFLGSGASPATADEYVKGFHDQPARLDLRAAAARLAAAIVSLGTGAPLGYEGPSLYTGAALGSALQRCLPRFFAGRDPKLLLVAGAAAGVSAIFKAPLTGLVFALEVPYQDDLARRMLLPAAISSAASYVVFAAVAGTEPLLPVAGQAPFDLRDLGGAALIGLVAGFLARVFIGVIHRAKALSCRTPPIVGALAAGVVLGATVLLTHAIDDASLALGPGYDALRWSLSPERGLVAIAALGTLRVIGTAATVGGGGVGGLFIPLVIQGALLGRGASIVFGTDGTLFPVVGMAAFLGAGYRVPLAAVVFVAEFTGRPGFVVPGLIAAVVAQLMMGRASISAFQVAGRAGHLERRLSMPLSAVIATDVRTAAPDTTVDEFFWQHLVATRQRAAPVVDGNTYLGMLGADDLSALDRARWAEVCVTELMRTDLPVASTSWLLADAVRAMEESGADRLAVVDHGNFVGVISSADLVKLDEILRGRSDLSQ